MWNTSSTLLRWFINVGYFLKIYIGLTILNCRCNWNWREVLSRTKTGHLICLFQRTLIHPELDQIAQVYQHLSPWNCKRTWWSVWATFHLRWIHLNWFKIFPGQSHTVTDGETSCPFSIEWIPDVLLQSKFGELSLQFQFGHQRHPLGLVSERNCNKRLINGISGTTIVPVSIASRRKKLKGIAPPDTDAKDLQNLNNIELDFDGVAPLNDSEFQELTKSVP